ncbi:MAG: lipid-binding SYLF domain-containing protein [Planctomycetia bacterium]|nr:lipid-binding SYLF domain-containing protein [Planctomycetia bacterium]
MPVTLLTVCFLSLGAFEARADPDQTVRSADQVLHEIMAMLGSQIPASLLSEAQGVAIIPDVIKVGFVAGVRRGHGVVLVRGNDGQWSFPQFVTLTGGSFGWQAGVQATDVVLVFMTPKSVEGLMRGKFTIGADASVAAGPVGRNAAAATDARLKAEILSYSRSRGLFAGLALDGSAIEIDAASQAAYYGSGPQESPQQVPESATKLQQDLIRFTQGGKAELNPSPTLAAPVGDSRLVTLHEALGKNASQLYAIVDEPWQKYLALPEQLFEGTDSPKLESLQYSLKQFDRVAQTPKYKGLVQRAEFQATYKSLREYTREMSEGSRHQLTFPPPPLR